MIQTLPQSYLTLINDTYYFNLDFDALEYLTLLTSLILTKFYKYPL